LDPDRHLKKSSDLRVGSLDVNTVPPSFAGPTLFLRRWPQYSKFLKSRQDFARRLAA
jgi:hypothetical protein